MTVYVDEPIHPYGRMLMCHMVSPDLKELFAMAETIDIGHRWFQDPFNGKASRPHFDISKGKRALAITNGAVAIDMYQMVVVSQVALNNLCLSRDPKWEIRDPLKSLRRHERFQIIVDWVRTQPCLGIDI